MMDSKTTEAKLEKPQQSENTQAPLTPAAERALAEAQARRAVYDEAEASMPKERGGRGGHDPVRYGDWEKKGLTSDF